MRTRNSKSIFFVFLFFSTLLVSISSFSPRVKAAEDYTTYISATDILKNFKFESIGDEQIVDEGAFNNKLRFDTQAAWILYKNDVTLLDKQEIGESTKLKYRLVLRNKINIYTNVRLNQMAQQMLPVTDELLAVTYKHYGLGAVGPIRAWKSYVTWEHWDFGDIYNYNWQNNYFSGRITMSFDIDDDPIPDVFGANTEKEYDYITVSDAGIVTNTWGKMSDSMPEIVVLTPSEYESNIKDTAIHQPGETADDNKFQISIDPKTRITVPTNPTQSFDSSILPDTAGSSLDPKNKDGTQIWDPETEEKSMTGALIHYDLSALSPVVYKYRGTLTYTEWYLETEVFYTESIWDWFATQVNLRNMDDTNRVAYGDVMLHGINRYIQVDMYVAFEVWASVKLGTLTDYYEQMRLEEPTEYYDALIWSTLAGGWAGSTIREYGKPLGIDFWGDLFGGLGGILILIITVVVLIAGVYIFFKIGMPMIRGRQRRNQMRGS